MFRAEQMASLPGTVSLTPPGERPRTIVNESGLDLKDAWVFEVRSDKAFTGVSLGSIASGARIALGGLGIVEPKAPQGSGQLDPGPFLGLLRDRSVATRPEEVGELRLIAWAEKTLAGQAIDPPVDRQRGFTLVVAHLQASPLLDPASSRYNALALGRERPPVALPIMPPDPNAPIRGMTTGRRRNAFAHASAGRNPRHGAGGDRNPSTPADARCRPSAADLARATAFDPVRKPERPGESPSMIEVSHFTKRYGEFVAVDDLNLSIGKGEVFGFIGPNGAGKSTTIRFLATLLRPTSGEGRVAGHSVVDDPMAVRKVIGFMPDDFGVYDGMKVWEFLDFFAVAYEIPRAYRKKIIGQVLELLDLTHKRDDYVNGLSKGMKQRLCLAKTLVHDPPVLILDEPASGLDPRARLEMKALLTELRGMGKTILISSHILSELADFCTSIGIIERGKLLAAGSINDIQRQLRAHRVLKVRVIDETTDRAASILRDESGVRSVESYDHTLTAEFHGEDEDLARLLSKLMTSGVGVHSFAEEALSLEEVFMMITKGIVN